MPFPKIAKGGTVQCLEMGIIITDQRPRSRHSVHTVVTQENSQDIAQCSRSWKGFYKQSSNLQYKGHVVATHRYSRQYWVYLKELTSWLLAS